MKALPVIRMLMQKVRFKCHGNLEICNQNQEMNFWNLHGHLKGCHGMKNKKPCPLGC